MRQAHKTKSDIVCVNNLSRDKTKIKKKSRKETLRFFQMYSIVPLHFTIKFYLSTVRITA